MNKFKRVSFDFDSTLTRPDIKEFAQEIINQGIDVWIVTSRFNDDPSTFDENIPSWIKAFKSPTVNNDLREMAEELGIPDDRIIYTNMELKSEFFKDTDFVWHLDDDWVEIKEINDTTNVIGITQVGNKNWKEDCLALLTLV